MGCMAHLLIVVLLSLGVYGGTALADENPELDRLRSEIAALIGPAVCSNLVNCRIAALGVNGCGGPKEYLVYSWRSTDKASLETKIAEYNLAQELPQNKEAAQCTELPQPVAACINGRCVLPGAK